MCFSCTLLFLLQCVTTYISFFVHYQKSAQFHTQWQSVIFPILLFPIYIYIYGKGMFWVLWSKYEGSLVNLMFAAKPWSGSAVLSV